MALDIKADISKLLGDYLDDPAQASFNALVLGESGAGKTFLARTCRLPVHIDSFDPGGSKAHRTLVQEGKVVVDAQYEKEDPKKPFAFEKWKANFDKREREGYFNHFSTYILDSSTTWSDAIMNWLLKKDGLAGTAPRFTKDYTPQKIEIRNWLARILALPCDVILTGHLKLVEDPEGGKHKMRFLTTGQGMVTIPLLFDEIYVLRVHVVGTATKYQLLTKPTNLYLARSRMAEDGKLDAIEEPNIKAILKKCGRPTDDKQLFTKEYLTTTKTEGEAK